MTTLQRQVCLVRVTVLNVSKALLFAVKIVLYL